MNSQIYLLALATCNLIAGSLVYVHNNLSFEAAWTRCHEKYRGRLLDLEKWTDLSKWLRSPCFETDQFFWHGSLMKGFPWIFFEGCYSNNKNSVAITMPYNSLAWCQNQCMSSRQDGPYFAVDDNLCFCNFNIDYVLQVENNNCNLHCDDSAMCGGNGYVNLYRNFPWTFGFISAENIDKRCIVFKCTPETDKTYEAVKCLDRLPYICENQTGRFQSPKEESWLTSNILCTNMLGAPTCRKDSKPSVLKTWTDMFRVKDQFIDKVSMTMEEVQRFLNANENQSSFYTNDKNGRRIVFHNGRNEYPSLCETDISVQQLFDDDQVCSITDGTGIRQASSTESRHVTSLANLLETTRIETETFTNAVISDPSNDDEHSSARSKSAFLGYEYFVIVGVSVVALVTVVGLVRVYRTGKSTRMTNSERSEDNVGNIPFVYSQNIVPMEDMDTIYNEIEDSCIAEIETISLPASNKMEDGVYSEIDPEQSENETLNGDGSVYVEVPDGVYDILNSSNRRLKRSGIENVYDEAYNEK